MYEQTLLERIADFEEPNGDFQGNSAEKEIRSIENYLGRLLNTNRGSVMIADDFGMPDMTSFSGGGISDTMERIEAAILETIKKYEKRLSKVKIHIESDGTDVLTMHFRLEGVLARQDNVPVFLDSYVRPGGRISVTK